MEQEVPEAVPEAVPELPEITLMLRDEFNTKPELMHDLIHREGEEVRYDDTRVILNEEKVNRYVSTCTSSHCIFEQQTFFYKRKTVYLRAFFV